jgi:hypothetical protein
VDEEGAGRRGARNRRNGFSQSILGAAEEEWREEDKPLRLFSISRRIFLSKT